MTDLPTNAIALIAFIVLILCGLLYKMYRDSQTASAAHTKTFMDYIEKKNGVVERQAQTFTTALDRRDKQLDDTLIKHDERQAQMLDDMAARLEANLPRNMKSRSSRSRLTA